MTVHARSSILLTASLVLAFATPASADPSAAPGESAATEPAAAASRPTTSDAVPTPTAPSGKKPGATASRPRVKTTALDGVSVNVDDSADVEFHKRTGAPVRAGETQLPTIGDGRAQGATAAGSARRVAAAEAATTAVAASAAHRNILGSGKEVSDAMSSAMPRLVACLPDDASGLQAGEVLVKVAVGRGGNVIASNVGSFSAVPSSIASCMATALGAASFDARRTRSEIVSVHLRVSEIDKRRKAPVAHPTTP